MAQQTISQALAVWRDGERLLAQVPPLSPDHESVARAIAAARDVYRALSSEAEAAAHVLQRSRLIIEDAQNVISETRDRRTRQEALRNAHLDAADEEEGIRLLNDYIAAERRFREMVRQAAKMAPGQRPLVTRFNRPALAEYDRRRSERDQAHSLWRKWLGRPR